MANIHSKRFSTREASPVPSETLVQGTESSLQPAKTSTVVVRTPAHDPQCSSVNDSSKWSPQRLVNGASGEGSEQTCEGANDINFVIPR